MDFLKALISPIVNFVSGLFTNSSNKKQTEATNAANMAMNQANIDFQKEENEIAREREDTAVQRRAADLEAAGLSKTLAAGSPASANQMNAPNNSFPMQSTRFESPKFDFDYASVKQNISAANYNDAAAKAAEDNARANIWQAKAATKEAKIKERAQIFEMIKFAKEHGLNLEKFGLDVEKFEFDKLMQEKNYELKKFVDEHEISYKEKMYQLSVDELDLARDRLNNEIMNTVSEVDYRIWKQEYERASLELDRNADKRAAARLKYDIVEIKARVENYISSVKLNEAQLRYVKKNTKKIVAEMLKIYDEHNHLNAETMSILQKTITEIYNRAVASEEHTTTSGHVVSDSEASENALDRAQQSALSGTQSMRQFFSIILVALFGLGKKGLAF